MMEIGELLYIFNNEDVHVDGIKLSLKNVWRSCCRRSYLWSTKKVTDSTCSSIGSKATYINVNDSAIMVEMILLNV